jgi:uncharacterized protein YbjT (DUF2867 family)
MSERKVIAVFGATGGQGGGLARAILDDPGGAFALRAITRKVDSTAAQALAQRGADVVAADADDPASLERALQGCDGAFFVTNFWEHFSPAREQAQALAMARAARAARLAHVIWSTLEDSRLSIPLSDVRMPTLMERFKVPHFDAKAEADRYFVESGVPTTYLLTSFYWENFIHFGMGPKPGPDGRLVLTLPLGSSRLPGMAVEDIGRCAFGILQRGTALAGRRIGIAGEHLTGAEMAARLAKALGREVDYFPIEPAAYRALGFPGADDLGNMFQFNAEFAGMFCAARSIEMSRSLNPRLQTLEQWLAANAARIPLQ